MNAYEFSIDVEKRIEALTGKEYRLRNTPESKRLIEEVLPIAKLALSLKQPGLDVEVNAFEDNGEYDGFISISGFKEEQLPVQVTYCHSYDDALRAEQVESKGVSFGSGPITRNKMTRMVESTAQAEDSDAFIKKIASEVVDNFNKKLRKEYSSKMVLVISFFNFKLNGLWGWTTLLEEIIRIHSFASESFLMVYLYNQASNEIYRVA